MVSVSFYVFHQQRLIRPVRFFGRHDERNSVLMDCKLEYVGPSEIRAGFAKYVCVRCGRAGHFDPSVNSVRGIDCQGWPLPSETSLWIDGFFRATGVSQALAICQYIRWRFRGSKLDELPPGIPRPDIARPPLSPAEVAELFPGEDPTLLGNRIKALTGAIGIPACGGCEARREWLNKAHAYLRGSTSLAHLS